jgi:hypothetical protein
VYAPKSEKIQSVKSHGSLHQTSDFRRWSEAALGDHDSHLSFDRVEGQISNWSEYLLLYVLVFFVLLLS